jgi:hypothetical protein
LAKHRFLAGTSVCKIVIAPTYCQVNRVRGKGQVASD